MAKKIIYHIEGFDCLACATKAEDILSNNDKILSVNIDVNNEKLFITYKDGNFCVATDPKDIKNPININKLNAQCCDGEPEVKNAFMNSIKDLNVALSELDPV